MIKFYKSSNGVINEEEAFSAGCWVNVVSPNSEEVKILQDDYNIPEHHLLSSLDEEERSRIDIEDGCLMIIVDTPLCEVVDGVNEYSTIPLGIIFAENAVVTICSRKTILIENILNGQQKGVSTKKRRNFVLKILSQNASLFLGYLRQAEKEGAFVEADLKKSAGNKELLRLLRIQKGLVYFSAGLKGDEVVLNKLLRMNFISDYPEDTELLEDVIVENKQAVEMCDVYRDILARTMEAYSGVVSNNLNSVMKLLAAVTIILTVPQIIFALWGVNTPVPMENNPIGFWLVVVVALVLTIASAIFALYKKWL